MKSSITEKIGPALFLGSVLILALLLLTACSDDGPFEEAGENLDDATSEARQSLEDAGEETAEELEDACEELSDENC